MSLTEDQIREKLRECRDPELPCNIVDLGLVYEIRMPAAGQVQVRMTLTSRECPMAAPIADQVKTKLLELTGVDDVQVDLVFDPPWDRSMINDAGWQQLRGQ